MTSVLIVDDESGIRQILRRWLGAEGYVVREMADADTALTEMTRLPADIVLCDIEMPGQNGVWLAAELRKRYPHTAVVLATAINSVPPSISLRAGMVEYLVKPFSRGLVIDAVRRAADWHHAALAAKPKPSDGTDPVATWLAEPANDL